MKEQKHQKHQNDVIIAELRKQRENQAQTSSLILRQMARFEDGRTASRYTETKATKKEEMSTPQAEGGKQHGHNKTSPGIHDE